MEVDEIMSTTVVSFTTEETKTFIKGADTRKYFSSGFTDLLTSRLNLLGISCSLKRIYNWFRKEDGRKVNLPFWTGKYECAYFDCTRKFDCRIDKPSIKMFDVSISVTGTNINHGLTIKKQVLRGESRKQLAYRIAANGIANTRSELFLEKSN